MRFRNEAEQLNSQLVKWRRHFHKYPELAYNEIKTSRKIKQELNEMGIEVYDNIAQTGLIGVINPKKKQRTILLRADMDALPVQEKNEVPFKSRNSNISHACGHDVHIASLLGVAKVLSSIVDELDGRVLLLFQPAEEKPPGGAREMLENKLFEDILKYNMALALHVTNRYEVGTIAIKEGPLVGSTDALEFAIVGKSGHASAPHEGVDANYVAIQVINAVYGMISRKVDPVEPVVFTIGRISGGQRYNVLSGRCEFDAALRTQNSKLREQLLEDIPKVIRNIASAFGADVEYTLQRGYDVGINHKKAVDIINQAMKEEYDEDKVIHLSHGHLIGEDFFEFDRQGSIPVALFWLGGKNEDEGFTEPNHSDRFNVDENCLSVGVSVLCRSVYSYLNKST